MNETNVLDRPGDLTIHICRKCHRVIRGTARKVSERGCVEYECTEPCIETDWAVRSSAGEPRPINAEVA